MHWWFNRISLFFILLVSACSIQPAPRKGLESLALNSIASTPTKLSVPADSQTGMLLFASGTFASGDTVSVDLQNPPAGISLVNVVQDVSTLAIKRFKVVLQVNAGVAAGNYVIRPRVTSGGVSKITTVNLTVTAAPANPGFKLTLSENNTQIERGKTQVITVFVTRIKGFNQALSLNIDNTTSPYTGVAFNPGNVAANAWIGSVSIQPSASATPLATSFVTKVKGTAGSLVRQSNLTMTLKIPSGDLDPRFGNNGIRVFDEVSEIKAVLQTTDRIVVAKRLTGNPLSIIVSRFTVNGNPDSTFGTNGQTSLFLSSGIAPIILDMAIDPNTNKILVLLAESFPAPRTHVLFRLNANGQLDTNFGDGGAFILPPANPGFNGDLVLQADGKIVVSNGKLIARVLSNGSDFDVSFGVSGVSETTGAEAIRDLAIQSDGKIIAVGDIGAVNKDGLVVRILSNGFLDDSFDGDGIIRIGFGSLLEGFSEIALTSSGKLFALGGKSGAAGDNKVIMAQFLSGGTLDTSFSSDGKLERGADTFAVSSTNLRDSRIIVQADDKPLIAASSFDTTTADFIDTGLIRQTTIGSLDTTFSTDGKVTLPTSLGNVQELLRDSKGLIVFVGTKGIARLAP